MRISPTNRTSQVPGRLKSWTQATMREAVWVPVVCLLLLVVHSQAIDLYVV